ncbi:response regulator transcription factor [Methylomonas sp. MO1]|uniref:response regulator transcription factor n=1 Tax=Methylomonas sp. MO1 TaxID=3073619 RepID=UPI0028A503B4|nr:response regulator transcription factor [Methylomonas sp. MO1]MDT4291843.1 response regulator transcription factor [Methylomonas sp. MO1]
MNILLIDDHFCAREGVACLLKQIIPELQVFEAESFDEGLALAKQTLLNLVMLDVQLPGKDGLSGLVEMKEAFPDLCVVMFSGLDDRELVFQALRLGAMGFIVKTVSRQVFVDALRDVLAGKVYLPASAVGQQRATSLDVGSVTEIPEVTDSASLGLTQREFEVLTWLVQGIGNKQIARQLGIEEQTVRNHLRPIYQKFGVAKRTELLVKVFERGIVFGKPGVGN